MTTATMPEAGRAAASARDRRATRLLLAPAMVLATLLVAGPFIYTIALALTQGAGPEGIGAGSIGLANFTTMFRDPLFWQSLRITLFLFVVCLAIETTLGLAIALLLRHQVPGRRWLQALVLVPSITASVAVAMMWLLLMQPDLGLVNNFLESIGLPGPVWLGDPSVAAWAIVVVDVWQWTPFMTLILVAGLRGLPEEPIEASLVDGASAWQRLRLVILPMLRPVLMVAVLLRSIDLLRFFDTIYVLTQGGPLNATLTLNVYGYRQGFRFFDLGYAAALQLGLLVLVAILAVIISRAQKRSTDAL